MREHWKLTLKMVLKRLKGSRKSSVRIINSNNNSSIVFTVCNVLLHSLFYWIYTIKIQRNVRQ